MPRSSQNNWLKISGSHLLTKGGHPLVAVCWCFFTGAGCPFSDGNFRLLVVKRNLKLGNAEEHYPN